MKIIDNPKVEFIEVLICFVVQMLLKLFILPMPINIRMQILHIYKIKMREKKKMKPKEAHITEYIS
jgi:hypothetical protein